MKHGAGIFQWESGNKFEGNYWMDLREGYGRMDWNDGSYYEGEWHEGLQHGQGRLCLPDGRIKEGIFRNNKFCGAMLLPKKQGSSPSNSPIREEYVGADPTVPEKKVGPDYIPPQKV